MDVCAADLPGNSRTAYHADLMHAQLYPAARQQAMDELIAECHKPGTVAHGWLLDYCADNGETGAKEFIEWAERVGLWIFSDRVEAIMTDLIPEED